MIEIATVSHRTDPSDYWGDESFDTVEFEDDTMGKQRTAYITTYPTLERVVAECECDSLIVELSCETMYDYPDADMKVKVYDGYNE